MRNCELVDNSEDARYCVPHGQMEVECVKAERDRYRAALEKIIKLGQGISSFNPAWDVAMSAIHGQEQ